MGGPIMNPENDIRLTSLIASSLFATSSLPVMRIRIGWKFAVKNPKLGEDIALAVVLKNKKNCKPNELKDFAQNKLARFKVPKNIYIVDEIPVGATGKIQRIGLAKKLGIE